VARRQSDEFNAKRNAAAKAMFDEYEAEQAAGELVDPGAGIACRTRGREA
jgi:hypothetical protein